MRISHPTIVSRLKVVVKYRASGVQHGSKLLRLDRRINLPGGGQKHPPGLQGIALAYVSMHFCAHLFRRATFHEIDPVQTSGPNHLRVLLLQCQNIHSAGWLKTVEAVDTALDEIRNHVSIIAVTVINDFDAMFMPSVGKFLDARIVARAEKFLIEYGSGFGRTVFGYKDDRRQIRVRYRMNSAQFGFNRGLYELVHHLRTIAQEIGE